MKHVLAVLVFVLSIVAAAAATAHPPYGLAADESGAVYFSDLETVWSLSPDGRLAVFRPHVPGTHVHTLAVAPDGTIVGDQNRYDPATQRFTSGLWRRSVSGAERFDVAMTERPPAGTGVWQDGAGNRYTSQWLSSSDRRVALLRRTPRGKVEVLFDEARAALPPQATVESVGGMAFGSDGSLFFANGGVLRRRAPDGSVQTLYDGGAGSSLRGIAAGAGGQVLAADMSAKTVLEVAPGNSVTTLYRETGAWLPTAVAVVGDRVLVLEANADPYEYEDRVRVIEVVDGRAEVLARPALASAAEPPASPDRGPGALLVITAGITGLAALFAAWRRWRRRIANA